MHHDDLFVGTTAPSRAQVEERLAQGLVELREIVERDLEAGFAEHTATVVASDFALQKRVARKLGRLGGSGEDLAAASLGIDFTVNKVCEVVCKSPIQFAELWY